MCVEGTHVDSVFRTSRRVHSEVKRLAALHLATYLPFLGSNLSNTDQFFMLKALILAVIYQLINNWKSWVLIFWGVVTMPLNMARNNQWPNGRAWLGKCFLGMVVNQSGLFFHLTDHACSLWCSVSLSDSENVIIFMIFLDYMNGYYKHMLRFCWFWRKQNVSIQFQK